MPVLCQYQPIIGRHWIRILRQLQTLNSKTSPFIEFRNSSESMIVPRRNNLSAFFSSQTVYYLATRAILQYPFIRSISKWIFKQVYTLAAGWQRDRAGLRTSWDNLKPPRATYAQTIAWRSRSCPIEPLYLVATCKRYYSISTGTVIRDRFPVALVIDWAVLK